MVSLIICGREPGLKPAFSDNIASTIGCEYEIIYIDNSRGGYNIFQAYNLGASRAKGDVLCFSHDDIRFHTMGWGRIAEEAVMESGGIVGVIGNQMMPCCEASWWTAPFKVGSITHSLKGFSRKEVFTPRLQPGQSLPERCDAVTVDGLWFCMPRSIFGEIKFDEQTYNGFHCYDSDICMQAILQDIPVTVVGSIDIEHFSDGHWSAEFFEQRQKWFDKWKKHLPVMRGVALSTQEVEIVKAMAEETNHWTRETAVAQAEVLRLRSTKAFRLGKTLLSPFSILKH